VECQAGHGEQIVDAGDSRCWRQVNRARPGIEEPCCADNEHLDAQSESDPVSDVEIMYTTAWAKLSDTT